MSLKFVKGNKAVYFPTLNFEGKVPRSYSFKDLGYTTSLIDSAKKWLKDNRYRCDEQGMVDFGFPVISMRKNRGGIHIAIDESPNVRISTIFYNHIEIPADNIFTRAHEEAHAAVHLGLGKKLAEMIGYANYENLDSEDFCDKAGVYTLGKNGLNVPSSLLVPHKRRLEIVENSMAVAAHNEHL